MEGLFYVNEHLEALMFDELRHHCASGGMNCMILCKQVNFRTFQTHNTTLRPFFKCFWCICNLLISAGNHIYRYSLFTLSSTLTLHFLPSLSQRSWRLSTWNEADSQCSSIARHRWGQFEHRPTALGWRHF